MRTLDRCLTFGQIQLVNREKLTGLELSLKIISDNNECILHTFIEEDGECVIWIHYSDYGQEVSEIRNVKKAEFCIDGEGLYIKVHKEKVLVCKVPVNLQRQGVALAVEANLDVVLSSNANLITI